MGKMFIDEEEQDLDWALNSGLVNHAEYKSLLEKTGLFPTEIEFL